MGVGCTCPQHLKPSNLSNTIDWLVIKFIPSKMSAIFGGGNFTNATERLGSVVGGIRGVGKVNKNGPFFRTNLTIP